MDRKTSRLCRRLKRCGAGGVLGSCVAVARAGGGPLGIGHEISKDESGIWNIAQILPHGFTVGISKHCQNEAHLRSFLFREYFLQGPQRVRQRFIANGSLVLQQPRFVDGAKLAAGPCSRCRVPQPRLR